MKKLIVLCAFLFGTFASSHAQFGIKGGLNFSSNGNVKNILSETSNNIKYLNGKTGYHIGVFYQTKGNSFYLRPELIYTHTSMKSSDTPSFDINKIDAPILVGYHVFKPLSIFAGPSLQYILDTDLKGIELSDVKNNFTVGVNIGAAVEFGKFGVDIRYEKGLSKNLANFAGISGGKIDTRPNQFIISMSLKL